MARLRMKAGGRRRPWTARGASLLASDAISAGVSAAFLLDLQGSECIDYQPTLALGPPGRRRLLAKHLGERRGHLDHAEHVPGHGAHVPVGTVGVGRPVLRSELVEEVGHLLVL